MYFVNLFLIFLFLSVCVYFDLKDRTISNKFLKLYFLISFILIPFEVWIYLDFIFWYIFIRILLLLFIFILVFTLFTLKLIGGGDGKILILLFHSLPFIYIFYFLQYYFLVFGLFLIIILIFNYIVKIKKKTSDKNEIFTKIMYSILQHNFKVNPESKDLREIRKTKLFPLVVPIFFSYIAMIIWLLI
ncbi:MAG: prepilin peptidase [Promethearchaeota archaeon]